MPSPKKTSKSSNYKPISAPHMAPIDNNQQFIASLHRQTDRLASAVFR